MRRAAQVAAAQAPTAAELAGAPQVVIAQNDDQHYGAQPIEALGIGAAHAPNTPDEASRTSALEGTLRHEVSARASSLANAICRDGAQLAAERLLNIGKR